MACAQSAILLVHVLALNIGENVLICVHLVLEIVQPYDEENSKDAKCNPRYHDNEQLQRC